MTDDTLNIAQETKIQEDVKALLHASDDYFTGLYPPESNHLVDVKTLEAPNVTFLVARLDGRAVGCCGYVDKGGYGEVKRLFVSPAGRGHRIGRRLMEEILRLAHAAGLASLKLEMGPLQPEAQALYEALGFTLTGPFGTYQEDPYSIFMERPL